MTSTPHPTTTQLEAILAIDTSTNVCSLALLSREGVIAERIDRKGNEHAALIARFADELKSEAGEKGYSIVAVAVSGGPGSYTGLRIGASFAKGYCFASGKPLIAVSTLESLAWGAIEQRLIPQGALIVPMIDAGRMEVYAATYSAEGIQLVAPHAEIIQPESYTDVPLDTPICLIGNGAAKCAEVLTDARFRITPTEAFASSLRLPAWQALDQGRTADVAYWVPDYIKPYNAVIAKNKVLNR